MSAAAERQQLGGLAALVRVLQRQDRQPVGDQDEHEDRHRERQHERRDPHADRALDLIAHLDRDRLEEQLHSARHIGRGDLGAQVERHRDDDHRGDRGRVDRVGVDGQAEPGGRGGARRPRFGPARMDSVIAGAPFFRSRRFRCATSSRPGAQSIAQAAPGIGQAEQHAQSGGPEGEGDDQPDDGNNGQPGRRVEQPSSFSSDGLWR